MDTNHIVSQDANKITVLEFPMQIRLNPGMYIGGSNDCSNILREIVDNALDELPFVKDYDTVIVESGENGSWFMVADKGRGLPIYMHEYMEGWTASRIAMSKLNAGGKFNKTAISSGMNGVGASTTNALSDLFQVYVKITPENIKSTLPEVIDAYNKLEDNSNAYYKLEFHRGEYISETCIDAKDAKITIPEGSSTVVYFEPDYSLIKNREYEIPITNIMYKAFMTKEYQGKEIHIILNGEDIVKPLPMYRFNVKHTFTKMHKARANKSVDLFFTFDISSDLRSKSYKGSVNSLVVNDGLHVKMAVAAIRKAISIMTGCKDSKDLEQGLKLRSILQAIKVDFKSQTKEYCNVVDGYSSRFIDELVPKVMEVLQGHEKEVKDYVSRITELNNTYQKLKDKQYIERKIQLAGKSKKLKSAPKSLFDSASTKRNKCELVICEGKSAGGILVQARDPQIHAVLGLRGRPMNTVMRNIKEVVNNAEMQSIINVIGMGVNQHHNLKNKRFGKIIVAADSDPDGGLITSSILATMAVHMTFLFNLGMVYVAESPLYILKDGTYIYPSDDLSKLDRSKIHTRVKGLGELNVDQARNIFFNKDTRRLVKVVPDGSSKAIKFLEKNASMRRNMAYDLGTLTKRFEDD